MARSPADLIDAERYPIGDLDSRAARALVARCRDALAERGACELPGFLRPEATDGMAREAAALAPRAHHHTGAATPYLEIPSADWPEDHPRRQFHPYSLAAVAYDQIPADSSLRALYEWDPLMRFFAAALDKPRLHRYADPLGACNVAVMGDGDELEWHFDQSEFVVSIALQDADEGGDFLYVPRIRSPREENYEAVGRLLRGEIEPQRIPMNPGTLLLFEGEYSIHTVSRCRGATPRLVALLAYDTEPGTCASELLQKARYGRVLRPPGEAAPA